MENKLQNKVILDENNYKKTFRENGYIVKNIENLKEGQYFIIQSSKKGFSEEYQNNKIQKTLVIKKDGELKFYTKNDILSILPQDMSQIIKDESNKGKIIEFRAKDFPQYDYIFKAFGSNNCLIFQKGNEKHPNRISLLKDKGYIAKGSFGYVSNSKKRILEGPNKGEKRENKIVSKNLTLPRLGYSFRKEFEISKKIDSLKENNYKASKIKYRRPIYNNKELVGFTLDKAEGDLNTKVKDIKNKDLLTEYSKLNEYIDYLHSKGITHNDIKPYNMLLSKEGSIKLGDFGGSRDHNNNNEDNRFCGTRLYLPLDAEELHQAVKNDKVLLKDFDKANDYFTFLVSFISSNAENLGFSSSSVRYEINSLKDQLNKLIVREGGFVRVKDNCDKRLKEWKEIKDAVFMGINNAKFQKDSNADKIIKLRKCGFSSADALRLFAYGKLDNALDFMNYAVYEAQYSKYGKKLITEMLIKSDGVKFPNLPEGFSEDLITAFLRNNALNELNELSLKNPYSILLTYLKSKDCDYEKVASNFTFLKNNVGLLSNQEVVDLKLQIETLILLKEKEKIDEKLFDNVYKLKKIGYSNQLINNMISKGYFDSGQNESHQDENNLIKIMKDPSHILSKFLLENGHNLKANIKIMKDPSHILSKFLLENGHNLKANLYTIGAIEGLCNIINSEKNQTNDTYYTYNELLSNAEKANCLEVMVSLLACNKKVNVKKDNNFVQNLCGIRELDYNLGIIRYMIGNNVFAPKDNDDKLFLAAVKDPNSAVSKYIKSDCDNHNHLISNDLYCKGIIDKAKKMNKLILNKQKSILNLNKLKLGTLNYILDQDEKLIDSASDDLLERLNNIDIHNVVEEKKLNQFSVETLSALKELNPLRIGKLIKFLAVEENRNDEAVAYCLLCLHNAIYDEKNDKNGVFTHVIINNKTLNFDGLKSQYPKYKKEFDELEKNFTKYKDEIRIKLDKEFNENLLKAVTKSSKDKNSQGNAQSFDDIVKAKVGKKSRWFNRNKYMKKLEKKLEENFNGQETKLDTELRLYNAKVSDDTLQNSAFLELKKAMLEGTSNKSKREDILKETDILMLIFIALNRRGQGAVFEALHETMNDGSVSLKNMLKEKLNLLESNPQYKKIFNEKAKEYNNGVDENQLIRYLNNYYEYLYNPDNEQYQKSFDDMKKAYKNNKSRYNNAALCAPINDSQLILLK